MLKSPILFAAAVMAASLTLAPQSIAQTKNPNVHKPGPVNIAKFKSNTRQTKLKCTGGAGHMTCTSKVAWVCPSGWKACPAPAGGTCCTQK